MSEDSIMNSLLAKKYVDAIGGLSNIKSTTSIGGEKMYLVPSEEVIRKKLSDEL